MLDAGSDDSGDHDEHRGGRGGAEVSAQVAFHGANARRHNLARTADRRGRQSFVMVRGPALGVVRTYGRGMSRRIELLAGLAVLAAAPAPAPAAPLRYCEGAGAGVEK